jgi:hypothetical protein
MTSNENHERKMLINKELLKLWILERVKNIETRSNFAKDLDEVHKLFGMKEVLEQLLEDFNLVELDMSSVKLLKDF